MMINYELLFVIFPTTRRFWRCTLRQGSNLCIWIILIYCTSYICYTAALLIEPDDVDQDYDVLYWDRPWLIYPLMITFLLIYVLSILACTVFMVGDCQHRRAKLKWVLISLYMSILLFLFDVLTSVLWFVFLMYNDRQAALWSVIGLLKLAFLYCSNMTVKSYFLELRERYPPYWQDPEDPGEDEKDSDNKRNTRKTKTVGGKSKASDRTKQGQTPIKRGTASKTRAESTTPGRVSSNTAIAARGRGRGRGRGKPTILKPARGRQQSNPATPATERTTSNLSVSARDRLRRVDSSSSQARTRNSANPSNPANPARISTQSNPARARSQTRAARTPERGRTPSNPPNKKKKEK